MPTPYKLTYLVRHGSYRFDSNKLDTKGIEASNEARDYLLQRGLGDRALVLCSNALRAIETAEIIASGLQVPITSSKRVRIGGNDYIKGIKNLDDWLDLSLAEAGVTIDPDQTLVVVTHAPMIAVAKGQYDLDHSTVAGYGEVFPYMQGSWQNPGFSPVFATLAERVIAAE